MREIGVQALREELSRVLSQVGAGETVTVTRGGKPIAQIAPVQQEAPPPWLKE